MAISFPSAGTRKACSQIQIGSYTDCGRDPGCGQNIPDHGTEGGTAHHDVRRLQKLSSWEELISLIEEVAATPDVCKTLVIDTADWAEQMCIDHICAKYKQPGIESFG